MSRVERLLLWDQQMSARLASTLEAAGLRLPARLVAHTGDSPLWFLGGLVAFLAGNGEVQRGGAVILVLIPVLGGLAFGLKQWFRRARPPGERGLLYVRFDVHAFPSSHAVRMGGLVTALAPLLPPWLVVLFIVWALFIALARVSLGIHYLLDVAAGMLLGMACGAVIGQAVLKLI